MATQAQSPEASNGEKPIICKRCHKEEATLDIRAEPVCQQCFIYYVNTKAIKRIETYKERGPRSETKEYLLPLSLGPSSTSLLYILDEQLRKQQERMGRTSYDLIVAHVDLEFEDVATSERNNALWEAVQARFPRHTYVKVGLEDALELPTIDWSSLGLSVDKDLPRKERLQHLLASIATATSRADIASTLLSRLLVSQATAHACTSILFGDSTTRLAEKTLTETAKGRGFSLPWQVSDGASPFGPNFYYPLRDLLKKEVVVFASLAGLQELVAPEAPKASASSKDTTIDALMMQYFQSVEENYPSIVANVVRTGSKLKAPEVEDGKACALCGIPVAEGTDGIYGWGGDQSSVARTRKEAEGERQLGILCYGCSRSING